MEVGATHPSQKVAVGCIVNDWMTKFLLGGARRAHLWGKSLEICYQRCTYDRKLEGMVEFEFEFTYKSGKLANIRTLCILRIGFKFFCLVLRQKMNCMSDLDWDELFSQ